MDQVKVFQDKSLAISCPLAWSSCLDDYEQAPANSLYDTHQSIPLFNIIYSINPNIKIPCKCKDLNPVWQTCCEELVNCPLYFLNMGAGARDLQKVFCPETTCIFQSVSNVVLLVGRKVFDLTQDSMII